MVVDDVVALFAGPLTALDRKTGEVRWTQKKVSAGDNSLAVWPHQGKTYLICNTGRTVACVDPKDGNVLWAAPGGGKSAAAVSGDHMVIFGGRVIAYKLSLEKAEKLWAVEKFADRGRAR